MFNSEIQYFSRVCSRQHWQISPPSLPSPTCPAYPKHIYRKAKILSHQMPGKMAIALADGDYVHGQKTYRGWYLQNTELPIFIL